MKRFIIFVSILAVFSFSMEQPTPVGEKEAKVSASDPGVIFGKDNENLLAVATGETIEQDSILQDLQTSLNNYVNSLDSALQKQLSWAKRFAVFKERIKMIK